MKKKDNSLLEQDRAVESYLESLLQEVPSSPSPVKPLQVRDNIVLLPDFDIPEEISESAQPLQPELKETAIQQPDPVSEMSAEHEQHHAARLQQDYDYPIQSLMFQVAGTQLSIPLLDLGNVVPWDENMTRLPSAELWSLGVLQHRGRNIRVVDSARLLNIRQPDPDARPGHILVFGDGDWALSCDRLGEVVKLESTDVQWRAPDSIGFSLGTIKKSLAQLLDPMKIMKHLEGITETGLKESI